MKLIKLFNLVFLCSLVFLSLDMYGQDRLINPTSTFLELGNDVPNYNWETGIGGAFVVYNKHLMPDGLKQQFQTEEITAQ
jgi:hypothetical protein